MYLVRNVASAKISSAIRNVSVFARIALLCLTLGTLSTACTENEDDIECGTPEFPCDDEVVTDDMIEV
ncbi:hypothetical protein [Flavilitoribacter nigricans]|uniref:Uncharacterized protein n=1 Tax=Flavilitoribacter nigricans (strain ATCC 23147 / DSM 23189 / NBRC 102662 / NCIMB 1420 / SS-2) TaxID=1122177 RepID=A0A2D0N8J5_FLAN2|nr:hypothetical protein [Flavilitoribacter nigricans]PHN04083.1 hypothetical protein CRP01_23075 [Flavilitoribacter nigricans DSM 23189 = NBRC 102662]